MKKAAGKQIDDIFTKKGKPNTTAPAKSERMGRPPSLTEPTIQVTCMLYGRQRTALDRLALDIEESTGQFIDRSPIIRAALDAVLEAGPDLTRCSNEQEIKEAIKAAFK